jgi:hypothetical protein
LPTKSANPTLCNQWVSIPTKSKRPRGDFFAGMAQVYIRDLAAAVLQEKWSTGASAHLGEPICAWLRAGWTFTYGNSASVVPSIIKIACVSTSIWPLRLRPLCGVQWICGIRPNRCLARTDFRFVTAVGSQVPGRLR